MGIFSSSFIKMTFRPSLWQRIQFLFARNVRVVAESDDTSESLKLEFNCSLSRYDYLTKVKS